MTGVATNLLGRWVLGVHHWKNPKYVFPEGYGDYSKKELARLTEEQRTYWLAQQVCEQIVAVTTDGQEDHEKLKFWVLLDGKPRKLTSGTVMPVGWEPKVPR